MVGSCERKSNQRSAVSFQLLGVIRVQAGWGPVPILLVLVLILFVLILLVLVLVLEFIRPSHALTR